MRRERRKKGTKGLLSDWAYGVNIDPCARAFASSDCSCVSPPSFFPSFSLPGLPGTTLRPLVRVPPVPSANRPGCHSARDAMPEVAAGSSRKSFLERARSKLLRWLRRSLRTTHQVIKMGHLVPLTKYWPVILITTRTLTRQFPGEARSPCYSCSSLLLTNLFIILFNEV